MRDLDFVPQAIQPMSDELLASIPFVALDEEDKAILRSSKRKELSDMASDDPVVAKNAMIKFVADLIGG